MKATELIKKLQDLIELHGDLPVYRDDEEYEFNEVDAVTYEEATIEITGDLPERFWVK